VPGTVPSIDQVAASNLAATLANQVDLPIATNISNKAISVAAKSELAQTSNDLISKPQIIQPSSTASHGITTYVAKAGDTTDSVAAQFKLSNNTVKWSNNLQSDALEPGRQLIIPPVDGLVYSAAAGDTATTIAQRYSADPERVVLFNDLELSNTIPAGTQVIVPGGSVTAVAAPVAAPTQGASSNRSQTTSIVSLLATGNRYDYGYCTWYAYNRRAALGRPIGGMWGDASSWAILARQSGFSVNTTPSVGAVMQTPFGAGGQGHVAVVEAVNPDGSIMVSEMNYAHWGPPATTRTIPAAQAGSYNYIH
jgi:surface antigen